MSATTAASTVRAVGSQSVQTGATEMLWDALGSGDVAQVAMALNAGADPNTLSNSRKALDFLDAFETSQAPLVTMMLLIHGATVDEVDNDLKARVTHGLRRMGFQCGPTPKQQLVGMHMLPSQLFAVYRETAADANGLAYPMPTFKTRDGRTLRGNLWRAIHEGDLDALVAALVRGASPLSKSTKGESALEALDAFNRVDAAVAALYLVIFGAPADAGGPALMDRLDLALLVTGFGCGAAASEATVGMHMLPDDLHPLYMAAVARANRTPEEARCEALPHAQAA